MSNRYRKYTKEQEEFIFDSIEKKGLGYFEVIDLWNEKYDDNISYDALRKKYKKLVKKYFGESITSRLYHRLINPVTIDDLLTEFDIDKETLDDYLEEVMDIYNTDFVYNDYEDTLRLVHKLIPVNSKLYRDSKIHVRIQVPQRDITIGILSDTHFNSLCFEKEAYMSFLEDCKIAGVDYFIHAGDVCEGDGSIFKGQMYELETIGYDNIREEIVKYLKLIERPIYMISGNHDMVFKKKSGFDMLLLIEQLLDNVHYIPSLRGLLQFEIKGGKYGFDIALQHGGRGLTKITTSKLQGYADDAYKIYHTHPDLLVVGHYHTQAILPEQNGITAVMSGGFQGITPYLMNFNSEPIVGGMIAKFKFDNKYGFNLEPIIYKRYPITRDILSGVGYQ